MKTTIEKVDELIKADYSSFEEMEQAIKRFASESASNREQLRIYLEEHKEAEGEKGLRSAIAALALGDADSAIHFLKNANESPEKRWLLGLAFKILGDYDHAIMDFERARARGWKAEEVLWQMIECSLTKGDEKSAREYLKELEKNYPESPYYYYCASKFAELEGDIESALDLLDKSVEASDNKFIPAMFRLAYLEDLHGDEFRAIELYRECLEQEPANINAAINLSILYEDTGKFDEAISILEQILEVYPNHPRVKLFFKDVKSSKTMVYDEETEKKKDKMQQILEIPITDFELSVRSRNCLKKMGIKTLGDLTKITEAELLSYKNFGETSLNEIKAILASKNLRLGQALEEKAGRKLHSLPKDDGDVSVLEKPIDILQLSARSRGCLEKLGVKTINELINYSESQLMEVKNFGQVSLNEIREKLATFGLSLKEG